MAAMRVLVIGGGVNGLATADALAGAGAQVTVLERHTVGHAWASSHGLSRAIRHEYGPQAIYTRMVARSLRLWADLARETGRHLYTETGVLTLGYTDDGQTVAGYETMRAEGLPVDLLPPDVCERRFPQFRVGAHTAITYNPVGGMMHASECLAALSERLRARGGEIREGVAVAHVDPHGDHGRVTLADGTTLEADRVVVTAGPWVHDVLQELALPIRATRQQVCYFAGLAPELFGLGRFPVFLSEMHYYGFPMARTNWLKIASHMIGANVDPNMPYLPDEAEVAAVRAFLRETIPAAAEAELAGVDCCMYDLSPDEDLILDVHPGGAGVIIGSGFSGHGFKFGIVTGELLASLALGTPPRFPLAGFRLARFTA
ncbi:MAG: N-methyl-L-tryptophan oxidase [Ktedonobacterales bacterium]|nr:N-methyl-L-tryptophan oxidase [Ktedonobacterales bacterium]